MEKQTSEDTEEAQNFKSCHFEQVWAVCVLCENSCKSCELQYLANILQWGSWGTWSCRQRIEAAGIKTRKGGTQRQGGQQLKSADPQNVCLWHPMTLWPEWYILVHVSYSKETKQMRRLSQTAGSFIESSIFSTSVWGLWSRRLWRSCQKLDGIIAFGEIFAGQEAVARFADRYPDYPGHPKSNRSNRSIISPGMPTMLNIKSKLSSLAEVCHGFYVFAKQLLSLDNSAHGYPSLSWWNLFMKVVHGKEVQGWHLEC